MCAASKVSGSTATPHRLAATGRARAGLPGTWPLRAAVRVGDRLLFFLNRVQEDRLGALAILQKRAQQHSSSKAPGPTRPLALARATRDRATSVSPTRASLIANRSRARPTARQGWPAPGGMEPRQPAAGLFHLFPHTSRLPSESPPWATSSRRPRTNATCASAQRPVADHECRSRLQAGPRTRGVLQLQRQLWMALRDPSTAAGSKIRPVAIGSATPQPADGRRYEPHAPALADRIISSARPGLRKSPSEVSMQAPK